MTLARRFRDAASGCRAMAPGVITLFAQHWLLPVYVGVFADQTDAPVPSLPTLVVAGALSASGELSLAGIFLVALVACVLGDLPWYWPDGISAVR